MAELSPLYSLWNNLTGQDEKPEPKQISPEILRLASTDFGDETSGTVPDESIWAALQDIPEEMWDQMHWMDKVALVSSPIPVVGTATGIAADVRSAIQEPDQFFQPANLALTGVSYIPFGRAAKYGEQLGIFAGTKAKDADLPALERAKEMQAAGASREQIWRDTGWFESNDGNWKWEIDDSQASLVDPDLLLTSGEVRDVLKHPALEGQYKKDVMGTDILVDPPRAGATEAEGSYFGSWQTDGGMTNPEQIVSQPMGMAPEQRIPSILHELQHNVQRREGFSRGVSPDELTDEAKAKKAIAQKEIDDTGAEMNRILNKQMQLDPSDPDYAKKLAALEAEMKPLQEINDNARGIYNTSDQNLAYMLYRNTAGEEEARAAANRWNLTAAERRERFPEEDMDIPLVDQIVRGQPVDLLGDTQKSVDYRGVHTAPLKEEGVKNTLDDMSDVYGEDVYDPRVSPKYYGHTGAGDPMDQRSADLVAAFQGKPDAEVTIYRAVPKGTKEINSGDWVTLNKNYAKSHGDSWVNGGEYDIISKKVKAKDIVTDGNSIHEFGYDPD